jgi:transposase-like protein
VTLGTQHDRLFRGQFESIAPVDNNGHLNQALTIQAHASGMDPDSPRPHCPFCGGRMQFMQSALNAVSARQEFDCKECGVILSVPPSAQVLEMVALR